MDVSSVWRALADPTRRQILDLLRAGPRTTGELGSAFAVSRFAVMKHLRVLEAAAVVVTRRTGRQRWNELNVAPLRTLHEQWLHKFVAGWTAGAQSPERLAELPAQEVAMNAPAQSPEFGVLQIDLDIAIAAPARRVWDALVNETRSWWPNDFCVGKDVRGFHFEAKLGGRMYEDWGDGAGLLWATVVALDPPRALELHGVLSPRFGGPATMVHVFQLEPDGDCTRFRLRDTVFGCVSEKLRGELESGWKYLFDKGLREYVERGSKA